MLRQLGLAFVYFYARQLQKLVQKETSTYPQQSRTDRQPRTAQALQFATNQGNTQNLFLHLKQILVNACVTLNPNEQSSTSVLHVPLNRDKFDEKAKGSEYGFQKRRNKRFLTLPEGLLTQSRKYLVFLCKFGHTYTHARTCRRSKHAQNIHTTC